MRRRDFLRVVGGAAAWPTVATAQRLGTVRRIGVLLATAPGDPEFRSYTMALTEALQGLGWEQGRNVQVEFRSFGGDAARAAMSAKELVTLQPDVIVSHATVAARALLRETRVIPIVFVQVVDPVSQGLTENLARPQGNMTGFTNFEPAIGGKWLKLLKDIAPRLDRVGVLFEPTTAPFADYFMRSVEIAVPQLNIEAAAVRVAGLAELEGAFSELAARPNCGLIVVPHPFAVINRDRVIALSARHSLPAIYPYRFFAAAGGLLSYGTDIADVFRDAATYVDRILCGTDPRNLPVQAPTRFEMVINLKTARTLGLEVPPTLLARADEVIE